MRVSCATANNVVADIRDMHLRKEMDTTLCKQYIAVSACNRTKATLATSHKIQQ